MDPLTIDQLTIDQLTIDQLTIDDFILFAEIAQQKSLSRVARERHTSPSRVSRALLRLEKACALKLVHRNTHGLSLTDDGMLFLKSAQQILAEHAALKDVLHRGRSAVAGTVKISISHLLGQHVLIPRIPVFATRFPDLRIDLQLEDRLTDMAQDGVDIAIRAGVAPAQTLIVRSLGSHGRALYASPGYAEAHGLPGSVADLDAHRLVAGTATPSHNRWLFAEQGEQRERVVKGDLSASDSAGVVALVMAGAGIGRINSVIGNALVSRGLLVPVLTASTVQGSFPVFAAILAQRWRAPRIRATMDVLEEVFADFLTPKE